MWFSKQGLFGAGIRRFDLFAVIKVVVPVHAVEKKNPRLGMIVGRFHDLFPEIARANLAIDPKGVFAPVGAGRFHLRVGFGAMRKLNEIIVFNRAHELIRHADGEIEVGQVAPVFRVNEKLDVRMVAAQYAHLRTPARPGGFDRFA